MNFLVPDFHRAYADMVNIVMWQLEFLEEESIIRKVVRQNPWCEEFCYKDGTVLAVISVDEIHPLDYRVVARFDRENIEQCRETK